MREGSATLIRREDYTAPAYWIRTVDLCFDLDPAKTVVLNRMTMERNLSEPAQPLRLHGEGLNLLRVLVNGESVAFRPEAGSLVIDHLPEGTFTLEIKNTCAPEKNTSLTGLYTSSGGFFTQCEAEGFRNITYFLDRPDVMAVYTVTLRANKARYPVLLSNGNLVEQGDIAGSDKDGKNHLRHYARWHDPFRKPSYLFALVAADLVTREQRIRTRAGREHLLQVYVRRGDLEKTEHAMNSLVASVVWDEARFKLPLDLERFMIVAVGDFNMGAMENKGLNIFNTKFVLANPATATDADYSGIESVVGHEYFHNWTGNRITCRDWFQLSLKEGLTVFRDQEFSQDMAGVESARAVKRIEDVRQLRQAQFPEDAGPMAHPVRPDSYVEINNFYTATVYDKGAEVVRMMQTLVGREGFAKGITLYFDRFDGEAVTCDDFAQSIADANPDSELARQLTQFKRWYSQAGTPRVTANGRYDPDTHTYTLDVSQHSEPSTGQPRKEPFVIPLAVGLIGRTGKALPLTLEGENRGWGNSSDASSPTERVLVLNETSHRFEFTGIDQPPVPSLLRGFSAPVVLIDGLSDADVLLLLEHDSDPFNRWEAGQRLALNRIMAAVNANHGDSGDGTLTLDQPFIDAMRALLRDDRLDAAFKELALTLPSEGYVAEQLDIVDPQRIHAARESMRLQLAQALRDDWQWAFDAHQVEGVYSPDPVSSGRRALANLALAMLCLDASASAGDSASPATSGDPNAASTVFGKAYQRFKDAGNMTDRLGALTALVNAHAKLAEPALKQFYDIFKDEALVIDKWFTLQAGAPEKDGRVFNGAIKLLKHPDFTLKNPNRARSLISTLCAGNPGAFHRPDGAGYAFWADRVLELDSANPQLAARMARVMDRWSKLAPAYRTAAREALSRVATKPDLSSDVREVVSRALSVAAL